MDLHHVQLRLDLLHFAAILTRGRFFGALTRHAGFFIKLATTQFRQKTRLLTFLFEPLQCFFNGFIIIYWNRDQV